MRFLYKTKQNIAPRQCKKYLERNDSKTNIECKAGANFCDNTRDVSDSSGYSESSLTSETSDACLKDSDMKIIRKRKVYKHNPSGHLDQKGECQLESCMEVDLSSSITGLNIESPQGQTCIAFERCGCKRQKLGGAKLDDKKEAKTNCLKAKPKAAKRKIRKSKRRKKKTSQCMNNDDYDEMVPIRGGVSNANIPYDIPYDDE